MQLAADVMPFYQPGVVLVYLPRTGLCFKANCISVHMYVYLSDSVNYV